VSNENKPVILHVHHRPDLMPLQEQAWRDWTSIVRTCDPSRPWISSDGEEDGSGILPVTMGHYGDAGSMREWKAIGKPWGVGEHSMAYYGTPVEVSKYNGNRAYESAEGRMEGLAYECYHLIRSMREAGASYSTVFNMAWYALKPLPLGKADLSSAPTLEDGIFFGAYEEGVPGVQPERLGPYGTTFNPGYDPALPLFDPWPLYGAMRAANAPEGSAWCQWADKAEEQTQKAMPAEPYRTVVYVGASDSRLRRILDAQGVVLSEKANGRTLYIVDAASGALPPSDGNDIWYWGINPETAPVYGLDIVLTPLSRSSFLPSQRSWTRGMTNADFYFCEVQRQDAARYTVSGPFVEEGEVLLEACRTDWRRWNKRAEELKTAALLRSEYECTAPLPVFVKNGNRFVSTLDDFLSSEKGWKALHTLLEHAGVPCVDVGPGSFARFDDGIYQPGILTRPVE
jgi:beta-galactosidase